MGLIVAAALQAEPPAELMKRLAEHNALLEKLPERFTVVVTSDATENDGDGKLLHRTHSVLHQTIEKGKRISKVVSATRDGKDDHARAQKEADQRDQDDDRQPSPFLAASQPQYRFTQAGSTPEGLLRISFEPRDGPSSDLFKGEAVVDPAAGELVSMDLQFSKKPTFVDRLDTKMKFDARVDGHRALSLMTFDGAGGFIFFKRQGGASIAFAYQPR